MATETRPVGIRLPTEAVEMSDKAALRDGKSRTEWLKIVILSALEMHTMNLASAGDDQVAERPVSGGEAKANMVIDTVVCHSLGRGVV